MEIQAEIDNELSLQDRIEIARSEFYCADGATNKRVKWRALAELMRRRERSVENDRAGNEGGDS